MEERLKKLCECVLNEKELTTSNLKKYGINGYYITKYINEGVIERISFGTYRLVNESILNEYKVVNGLNNLHSKSTENSKSLESGIPIEIVEILNTLISERTNETKEDKINHYNSKEKLAKYLRKINKEDYYYLISSYIEINDLQNNLAYSDVVNILMGLNNGTYKFDIDYFAREFYKAGQLGNVKIAEIYYKIIKNSAMFTKAYQIADGMEDALNYYEKTALKRRAKIKNNQSLEYELKINNFGISNTNKIIELISNGVSIEDIIMKLNLSKEIIPYLYLLIAEYYYSYEMFIEGDAFIIMALNNNKDNNLINAIKEVLSNRSSYYKIESSFSLKRTNKKNASFN